MPDKRGSHVPPGENICLIGVRHHASHGPWAHVFVAKMPVDAAVLDGFDIAYVWPLYTYPTRATPREHASGQMMLFDSVEAAERGGALPPAESPPPRPTDD